MAIDARVRLLPRASCPGVAALAVALRSSGPPRTGAPASEHDLLAACRALAARQRDALPEVARNMRPRGPGR